VWRADWIRRGILLTLLAATVAIAWFADERAPAFAKHTTTVLIEVTAPGDRGPGTLREAIYSAVQARGRARIVIRVPRVTLSEPLPPASHELQFEIEARPRSVIDARALGADAVLDIRAPVVALRNVGIEGAPQVAVLLRAHDVVLDGVAIDDADVGVAFTPEVARFAVRNGAFSRNRIALQSSVAAEGVVTGNLFKANSGSAIRLSAASGDAREPAGVRIADNRFEGDNDPIVIVNRTAVLERNRLVDVAHDAITLRDADARLRENVIRGAGHVGILVDGESRVDIADNEIGASAGTGIVLAAAREARVSGNRLYANLDGIVQLAQVDLRPPLIIDNLLYEHERDGIRIVGSSPVVRGNRSMRNRGAGLRMVDAVAATGRLLEARPLLDRNVFAGNRSGDLARTQVPR